MQTLSLKSIEKPETTEDKFQSEEAKEIVRSNTYVKKKKSLVQRLSEIGTVSSKEVVEFTRHISVMLGAGVTIFEAIKFIRNQSKNKVFQARLDTLMESLNNGQSLSTAMRKFPKIFPEIYVNIIRVGEQAGTLPDTLNDLADHLEENEKFKSKVKGALIYPKIILAVMTTFILILMLFVLPRILTIFKSMGATIPLSTRIMINATEFVNSHVGALAIVVFALISVVYVFMKNPIVRKWRDLLYIKMPFVGHIVLNYNTAQVAQQFGTLFASGITIVRCLEITASVMGNIIFRTEIEYMVNKIKSGVSLSQSFPEKSHFPPMFVKLINVGERTGKLPHVINYMKNYYKGLVDNDVKNITTIIEPLIMMVLGLLIAGLVVTVIGPIYQLISNISSK